MELLHSSNPGPFTLTLMNYLFLWFTFFFVFGTDFLDLFYFLRYLKAYLRSLWILKIFHIFDTVEILRLKFGCQWSLFLWITLLPYIRFSQLINIVGLIFSLSLSHLPTLVHMCVCVCVRAHAYTRIHTRLNHTHFRDVLPYKSPV